MILSTQPQNSQSNLNSIAVFSAAQWESALVILRVTDPTEMADMREVEICTADLVSDIGIDLLQPIAER